MTFPTTHRVQPIAQRCAALWLKTILTLAPALAAAAATEAVNPYALGLQWQDDQGGAVRLEQFRGQPVQIVVVSYDPANDNPRTWSSFREHHHYVHPNWHFLTGTDASTRALAGALDFKYWAYDEHVVHDFKILLLGADGRLERELTWPNRNESVFVTPRP
jgi:cytochrome oxidase Cu insertion factor (SCO1/SenC/PrrC family)